MATRFGATPAQANATKLKWLIGCLVTLVLPLIVTFIFYAQNSTSEGNVAQPEEQQPIIQPVTIGAEIVVPVARIEEGTRLEPSMFTTVQLEDEKVPLGAVRKQDLEQIVGKFSNKLLAPSVPLKLEDITETRVINALSIPAGYRAVTITVDNRSGVEGFAKPNTRVDVLWTFTQDGKQKVSTIVRFTKILSVGGVTASDIANANISQGGAATTVTLLVSERDAKKIELARTLGSLSLSLVGDQEESTKESEPDAIGIGDLLNDKDSDTPTQVQAEPSDGFMITTDPKTGRQMRYLLNKSTKKWSVDRSLASDTQ